MKEEKKLIKMKNGRLKFPEKKITLKCKTKGCEYQRTIRKNELYLDQIEPYLNCKKCKKKNIRIEGYKDIEGLKENIQRGKQKTLF